MHYKSDKRGVNCLMALWNYTTIMNVHDWLICTKTLNAIKLQLWMWLVHLNCNFECDWLIGLYYHKLSNNKLPDNKLSDINLASEIVKKRAFLSQQQSRK